ncbi:MAG TPA: YeeE/YedE thiosulfate transporter family protein [Bacteroidia bacterium]|nr:YeeE/YedE thiosulfate transporter family protein [Bacteroidia bacterium]HRG53908.1 YeeE/YedE thiosulfate transporter family protein [Bacteroidia bacterium]
MGNKIISDEFAEQEQTSEKINYAKNIKFLFVGVLFGITLVKAEMMSWFRIQEMFRFNSFHMYGIMATAVLIGVISVLLIKRFQIKTIQGDEIKIEPKQFSKGQLYGGLLFGFGWAMTGACPGPLIAQIGGGFTVMVIGFFSAVCGAWMYAYLKDKLPH